MLRDVTYLGSKMLCDMTHSPPAPFRFQMAPQVLSIQPCAIVDHLCIIRDEAELKQLVADEVGASWCCLRCLSDAALLASCRPGWL